MELKIVKDNIFFFDGVGAFLSAAIIGMVLPNLETGMPRNILFVLSMVAVVFSLYSLGCYRFNRKPTMWLKVIAIANVLYCLGTLAAVVVFFKQLSLLAIVYFILEVAVIAALACLELKITRQAI